MKTNLALLCSFVLAAGCSTQRAPYAPLASNDPALTSSNVHTSANSPQHSSAGHVTTTETSTSTTTSRAARASDNPLVPASTADGTATVSATDRNLNGDGSRVGLPSSNEPSNSVAPATPVGGLTGALVGMGIPEYEAKLYEGKLRAGNLLVSVHSDDSKQRELIEQIFKRNGARDVSTVTEASVPKDARV